MKLVIVGGGVTALAAAHRAVELARERGLDLDVKLVEARRRLGGTIATERADGFLVEAGPGSFFFAETRGVAPCWRLGLLGGVGLHDRRLPQTLLLVPGP